jgi:hypothetical protein
MTRRLLPVLLVLAIGLSFLAIRCVLLKRQREASYELILRSYQRVLQPGMNRKQVEDYFHAFDFGRYVA